uniref:Tetratricopeptide repeat protein 1 n=1 Tax=Lygus hesperus TaxID=30085 RepID=A0A0A9X6M6_LYGHE
MSEKDNQIPTNKELVDGLVDEFKSACDLGDGDSETPLVGGSSKILEESEESDPKEEDKSLADDYIDEEALKDKELTYSDEDRERLKQETEALKNQGNNLFKNGSFLESIDEYTLALRTCPLSFNKLRAVLYANRAAAKVHLGRKVLAIEDCTKAIELDETYIKAYIRRATLYEETEKFDEALGDYNKVLEFDRTNADALKASVRLPPLIEKKNEELKAEMMGKLKDLGNTILKPFGLSTNNFQMVQDPVSGGYSINFKS